MATASTEVDEIRRRMALIRHELHEDVQDVVASAEAVTDWQRYIRRNPWVALGVSFAVGYLVVPKRRRKVPRDLATPADVAQVREAVADARESLREAQTETKVERGLLAATWGLLGPMALRAAQGYAMQYLENWMMQQHQRAGAGPAPQQTRADDGPGAVSGRTRGPAAH